MLKRNEANKSGLNSEAITDCVLSILRQKGYLVTGQYTFKARELRKIPVATEKSRVDFFVRGVSGYETGLIIETRCQDEKGTADQKMFYKMHEIHECYPYPTILIVLGSHWSDKWKAYCIDQKGDWLIDVFFSYESLLLWCEKLPPAIPNNDVYKAPPGVNQPSLFDD